jgi:hypothetical protein
VTNQQKDAALKDFKTRLESRLSFDPTIILAIIEAVLNVLKNACPAPGPNPGPDPGPTPSSIQGQCAAALEGGGMLARLRLRRSMREHGVPFRAVPDAMDAVFEIGKEASDADVRRAYACAD